MSVVASSMGVQLVWSVDIDHTHSTSTSVLMPSWSSSTAVTGLPAEGGAIGKVIVPGSPRSVTVTVTLMVASTTGVCSSPPASSLPSLTVTVTLSVLLVS